MSSPSAYRLTGVSLTLDVGYLLTAPAPDLRRRVSPLGCSLLQLHAAATHHSLLSKEVSDVVQEKKKEMQKSKMAV